MNKKTKRIVYGVVGLVIAFVLVITVKNFVDGKVEDVQQSTMYRTNYSEASAELGNIENSVRGAGTYTSFNIAKLNVNEGSKIINQYVNDGDSINAQGNVMQLSDGYTYSYLKSPIAGLFFAQQSEGLTSYSVYDISNTGVLVKVNEEDAAKITIGQSAVVRIIALDKEIQGTVVYVSKVAENGTFNVKVAIPYSDDLRFGYNANVRVITTTVNDAICIPYNAVRDDGDGITYVVNAKHRAKLEKNEGIDESMKTLVKTGATDGEKVEILEGLKVNDKVLIAEYQ